MREKMIRLAKFNQKWFGAVLLTLIYFLGLGPAALYHQARLALGLTRKQEGWQKAAKPVLNLRDLEEQS